LDKMIIDAKGMILGKLGTVVAKYALEGESVEIINSEEAVITGKRDFLLQRYQQRMDRGNHVKGPFYTKMADRFIKRTIRGMLPYKRTTGLDAFNRITCHIGVPTHLKDQKAETIPRADISKSKAIEYVTVGQLCVLLGAKK